MSKISLDLKNFKHLHSKGDTTTLQHKDGHLLTIANKALGPEAQSQLSALAKIGPDSRTADQANEAHDQKMAEGGNIKSESPRSLPVDKKKQPAQPQSVLDYSDFGKIVNQKNQQYKKDDIAKNQPKRIKFADGSADIPQALDPNYQAPQDPMNQFAGPQAPAPSDNGASDIDTSGKPDWMSSEEWAKASPQVKLAQDDPARAMQMSRGIGDKAMGALKEAHDKNMPERQAQLESLGLAPRSQGAALAPSNDQGSVTPPSASQTGENPDDRAPVPQAAPIAAQPPVPKTPAEQYVAHKQEIAQTLSQEDQAWQHDLINGHITPKTYSDLMADKGTLGRVRGIFGLMLSGAGSGLSHQPNALLEMMNQEIKNDLQAQEKSKDNAQNFIKINQQQQMNEGALRKMVQEGHLNDAQANNIMTEANIKSKTFANMQMNRAALHAMSQEVDKYPVGSQKRQQAEQQLAAVANVVNAENSSIADVAASRGALNRMVLGQDSSGNPQAANSEGAFQQRTNGLRVLGQKEMADNLEEKHIPGIAGQASKKIESGDRQTLEAHQKMEMAASQLKDFVDKHGGVFDRLSPQNRAIAAQMVLPIQAGFREGTLGTVYREGEQPLLDKAVNGQPLDLAQYFLKTSPAKLEQLRKTNSDQMNLKLKNLGFPQQQSQQGASVATQYKTVNGVKYMRGPNGEAIPVK